MTKYDAIVIGSGQGGTPLAKKLAHHGWKTALVEKQEIGGTCINVGCTPTKTMIASAKRAYEVSNAQKAGIEVDGFHINLKTILARKNEVVQTFRGGSKSGLEETKNLDLVYGKASFIDSHTINVQLHDGGITTLAADKIFIDTGAHPFVPPISGLENVGYFTSTTIMECTIIPKHLLIIGGAYIGLEFGQMYRRFGSEVTIIESGERFLNKEDEDIAEVICGFLKEEGIELFVGTKSKNIMRAGDSIVVTIDTGKEEKKIECSHILVAAGRTPNSRDLNLQAAGVETDERGHIIVNEKLETTAENIWALGDVKGGPEFTHIAYNDHVIILENLLNGGDLNTNDRVIPYTMFTDPQLGRVGMTETEARKQNVSIRVAKLPMSHVARAIETGDTRGIMKAVVDAENDKILGAAIVSQEGGEIMSVLQMAMIGGITWRQIRYMIFAHPLYAESLNNLFMKLEESE